MKNKKVLVIALIALAVFVGVYTSTTNMLSGNGGIVEVDSEKDGDENKEVEPLELPYKAPLTGEPLENEMLLRPLAVVVENSPNARPQSGLKQADVVYEVLAEGGITRFLVIYQQGTAELIGPVRSARHYMAYMAHDFDGVFVHVGGSPQGLTYVGQNTVANLNAYYIASGEFWRTSDRRAPHNLYSSTEKMRSLMKKRNLERDTEINAWPFLAKGEVSSGGSVAEEITIKYPVQISHVRYLYDENKNNYKRYMGGVPHLDRESESQLTADNIIVQYANTRAIPGDNQGRLDIDVVGAGEAVIFTNGRAYEANWKKSDKRSRTIYTDKQGEEIPLTPGSTWVQIVRTNTEVVY
ncbi:hypothetical protein GGQ84_001588 [Desulfitispora alkaliphila]|uniref:DUF3048 domain-containing protein n=1 Tax=Desulfitispora alkaliphila TaxID=622674 RepID=UPI003D21335D